MTPEQMIEACHDPAVEVRLGLAEHLYQRGTPAECTEILAADESPDVRCVTAMRGKLSPKTEMMIAEDPDPRVRLARTKMKSHFPTPEAAAEMAGDDQPEVRLYAAGVPDLDPAAAKHLALDPHPEIREATRRTQALSRRTLRRSQWDLYA